MSKGNSDIESLQAKIVVLGDNKTGKSSLIRSLDPYSKNISQTASSGEQTSFTVIEIPSNELETIANVFLKFWEYSGGSYTGSSGGGGYGSKDKEQEIAFPGALFCIITLDMRAPETANAAFNKWITIKETQMSESFLFVVGTFLDDSIQRRVEISEICKACAQKEAIYIEVSNLDGSNINLLRRLICQRLNQMLKIREDQKHAASVLGRDPKNLTDSSDESKTLPPTDLIIETISPALLEKNILSHSIGGIYTSAFFATSSENEWNGFEKEQQNLSHIGKRISTFIDQVSLGLQVPLPPDDYRPANSHSFKQNMNTSQIGSHEQIKSSIPEPDADEIRHLFDLMGLPLPPSLELQANSNGSISPSKKKASVKMKVRLPDGNQANLVLRSGDNIEQTVYQFLVNHEMKEGNSMNRLVDIGTAMLRQAEEKQVQQYQQQLLNPQEGFGHPFSSPSSRPGDDPAFSESEFEANSPAISRNFSYDSNGYHDHPSTHGTTPPQSILSRGQQKGIDNENRQPKKKLKKCKARIQLPNNQVLETIVTEGENARTIANRLGEEYGLSMGYQHKMWEQLQIALDTLERKPTVGASQSGSNNPRGKGSGPNSKIL